MGKVTWPARFILLVAGSTWVGLAYCWGGWLQYGRFLQTWGYSLTALFFGAFLVVSLTSSWLGSILSNRCLRFLGRHSYALYVIHIFPLFFFAPLFARGEPSRFSVITRALALMTGVTTSSHSSVLLIADGLSFLAVAYGLTLLLSIATWYLLERPFLNLKRFFPYTLCIAAPTE